MMPARQLTRLAELESLRQRIAGAKPGDRFLETDLCRALYPFPQSSIEFSNTGGRLTTSVDAVLAAMHEACPRIVVATLRRPDGAWRVQSVPPAEESGYVGAERLPLVLLGILINALIAEELD